MQLHLLRTYTKIGLVGQLYHEAFLVLYWIERNADAARHSCFFSLPEGSYQMAPSGDHSTDWKITSIAFGAELQTARWALAPEVTLIPGCEDPVCFISPDGETQLTKAAMGNLEDIFHAGHIRRLHISLAIENTIEYYLNKKQS